MSRPESSAPPRSLLFTSSQHPGGAYDEFFAGPNEPRGHWRELSDLLERLGPHELAARSENCRRILREHGVSCFVSQHGRVVDEPWRLDLLPMVISAREWASLEAGLIQRARLLNLVLRDLHGVQRLLRDGLIPAPLVYANPGYHRACQAVRSPAGAHLHTYAVDLGRSPDGRWWVLADRTQTPPGIGFMLENRTVISRVLPEALEAVRPRSLTESVRLRRDTLCRLAPSGIENPTVVLLTPGPRSEGYFEHSYLARLLGFILVEGDDLTVRDRKVFMKTLEGLRPVHVILRRIADAFCDPLELRSDSLLGVPGLVEATRAGGVAVINALGGGLLESPAYLPFMPGLCRHLMGEELAIPSVATWWCGQGGEQDYVREHFDELAIRPAFGLGGRVFRPRELSSSDRQALLDQLTTHSHEFVGQEEVRLSRVPLWADHHADSRAMVMRLFVLFDGEDYHVMPGGLARLVRDERVGSASLALSGPCKDVWVLPPADRDLPLVQSAPVMEPSVERTAWNLPSRTADNFFWLGRYAERLENVVRTARCAVVRLSDDTGAGSLERILALERLLVRLEVVNDHAGMSFRRETLQEEILMLLQQEERPLGIRNLLGRIHFAAFSVRYWLSADTWRIINQLEPDSKPKPGRLPLVYAASMLNSLVLNLAAFSGMEMENMTRDHRWVFLDLGRRIERASNLARLLQAVIEAGDQSGRLLEPTLEISDSVMTYRRRYFSEASMAGMLELVVGDASNPRSFAFQLARIQEHALGLPHGAHPDGVDLLRRRVLQLHDRLREFATPGFEGNRPADAAAFLEYVHQAVGGISELLTQVFFSHVTPEVS